MKLRTAAALILLALSPAVFAGKGHDPVPTKGATPGKWTQDYDAALALAKEHGLPVLLKFTGSDWCPVCIRMERDIFSKEEFAGWADGRVMLVTIDFARGRGIVPDKYKERNSNFQRQYQIKFFPTYVIIDAEERERGRLWAADDMTVGKFTSRFEALVGTMPEKVSIAGGASGAGASAVDQWLQSRCTIAQRKAFAERLTAGERAEFPDLIAAEQTAKDAVAKLQNEREAFIDGVKKELAALPAGEAEARKAKAMEELRALEAAQKEKTAEIEAERKRKADRLAELVTKLR
jgi:thiol-disulfide isomerase/thioredoxin